MQILVGHLLESGNAGLDRNGDRPAYFERHRECGEYNKEYHQDRQYNAPIQRGFKFPLAGLNGDAPRLIAANGSKPHKFVIAIKIICAEASFSLDHTLIHGSYIRHAGIRFHSFDHVGALLHDRSLPMTDHIALVVQHIGYTIVAHGQVDHDV